MSAAGRTFSTRTWAPSVAAQPATHSFGFFSRMDDMHVTSIVGLLKCVHTTRASGAGSGTGELELGEFGEDAGAAYLSQVGAVEPVAHQRGT